MLPERKNQPIAILSSGRYNTKESGNEQVWKTCDMKLLADAMLGRLARWLRILGYDTTYVADTDDFAVLRSARADNRLILTRDRALAAWRGVRTLLIDSGVLEEQLKQVCSTLGPPEEPVLPRCSVCNQTLHDLSREAVATRVPPFIHRNQKRFKVCPDCERVYWQGTHWRRIRMLINGLRDAAGSDTMTFADDCPKDLDS